MEQKMEVIYEDEQLLICYKPAGTGDPDQQYCAGGYGSAR